MARQYGDYDESSNINGKFAWTFDSRNMVGAYADLLLFLENDYIPNGFPISVFDVDPDLRGFYMCINKNDITNPASWEKAGVGDLANYYTKDEIDEFFAAITNPQEEYPVVGATGVVEIDWSLENRDDLFGENPTIMAYELDGDVRTFFKDFTPSYNSVTKIMSLDGIFGDKTLVFKR